MLVNLSSSALDYTESLMERKDVREKGSLEDIIKQNKKNSYCKNKTGDLKRKYHVAREYNTFPCNYGW